MAIISMSQKSLAEITEFDNDDGKIDASKKEKHSKILPRLCQ
jgi:hypothetical protein